MGLAQVQSFLAELYTDAALRDRYFAETAMVSEQYGLSSEETHQIRQMSAEQVDFFAGSLQRKRLNGVASLLPLSRRALGERFTELFTEFSGTFLPFGTNKQRKDARAFAIFVERLAQERQIGPRWVLELMRYEAAELAATDPTSHCVIRWFHEPLSTLVRRSAEFAPPLTDASRATLAIWWRISPGSRLGHISLSFPRL